MFFFALCFAVLRAVLGFKVHQPEASVENLNRVPNLSGPKPKKHQVEKKPVVGKKNPGLKKKKPSWFEKKLCGVGTTSGTKKTSELKKKTEANNAIEEKKRPRLLQERDNCLLLNLTANQFGHGWSTLSKET